jgi:hypothetical protein
MKRSFESGYAKRKKAKEQEERIQKLQKLTTIFSKTTTATTSTSTNTSRLVSSIAEGKEEQSIYTETCSETEGEDTTSDTSVNVSEQQSENTANSDPALWSSTNKNLSPTGLRRVHPCVKTSNIVLSNQPVHTQLEIKILKQDI